VADERYEFAAAHVEVDPRERDERPLARLEPHLDAFDLEILLDVPLRHV
jgi:hypothetical protein